MVVEVLIVLWLVVIGPLVDIPLTNFLRKSFHPRRRIYAYAATIIGLTIATLALIPTRQTTLLESPFGSPPLGLAILAWCLVVAMAVNTVQVWILVRKSDEYKLSVHQAYSALDFFLPSTISERKWFVLVALAAGFFEEILFRSFMIRLFESLPMWAAALISAVLFGVAHLYQGWKNAIGTFCMALIFTVIVAGTGTLVVAMITHAIWDLRVLLFTLPSHHRLLTDRQEVEGTS